MSVKAAVNCAKIDAKSMSLWFRRQEIFGGSARGRAMRRRLDVYRRYLNRVLEGEGWPPF